MAHLANPSESVSLFAMFSFVLLKNISMFPDLEMINKNARKWRQTICLEEAPLFPWEACLPRYWRLVWWSGAGVSGPAPSPLQHGLGRTLTSPCVRLSFCKMKRFVKQLSWDCADGSVTNVRPGIALGTAPGTSLGLNG